MVKFDLQIYWHTSGLRKCQRERERERERGGSMAKETYFYGKRGLLRVHGAQADAGMRCAGNRGDVPLS